MGKHDIGDLFKDRVHGYASETDTDALFAKLNLKQKKKRRSIPWIWFLGAMLLFISGAIFLLTQSDDQQLSVATKESINVQVSSHNHEEANKTVPITPKTVEVETHTKDVRADRTVTSLKPSTKTLKEEILETPSVVTSSQGYTNIKKANIMPKKKIEQSYGESSNNINNTPIKGKEKNVLSHAIVAQLEPSALTISKIVIDKKPEIISYNHEIILEDTSVQKRKKKDSEISLVLTSGLFGINRQLNASRPELNDHLARREQTESPLEMISAGAGIRFMQPSGLFYEVGLEYQSINELFQQKTIVIDTIPQSNQPTAYVIEADLDTTVLQFGSGYSRREQVQSRKHYNSHTLLTVPISLGYVAELNRWSLQFKGGVLIGLRKFDGIQIGVDDLTPVVPSYHPSQLQWGARFSAGIGYQLSDHINLSLSPMIQSYFNSFTNKQSGYEQRYLLTGLELGLSYGL